MQINEKMDLFLNYVALKILESYEVNIRLYVFYETKKLNIRVKRILKDITLKTSRHF